MLLGEGDREVLDLQNRVLAGVLVDQAISPGELGHSQGAEPLGQRNILGCRGGDAGQGAEPIRGVIPVGDGGVGDHRLSGVVPGVQGLLSLHGLLIGLNIGLGLDARRGHRIGQPLGQDVEAQGGDEDEQAGEEGRPPVARQEQLLALGEHVAPGRSVDGLDARTDEGQRGLEDDRVGHQDGCEDHDRGDAVAGHVLEQDPRHRRPHHLGGGHIVLPELGDDVGAHHAGELGDVEDADGDDDDRQHRQAGRHRRDEDGRQSDAGEGHDDVEHAHEGLSDPLARRCGNGPEDRGHHKGQTGGRQAHDQRDPGAVDGTGEDVTTGAVRPEQVRRGRGDDRIGGGHLTDALDVGGRLGLRQPGGTGRVGGDDGSQDGDQGDEAQHDDGDLGADRKRLPALEAQPGPRGLIQCGAVQHQMLLIRGLTRT